MSLMNCMILFIIVFSCVFAEKMRNIDYLSFGYDVYTGNPLSTIGGVDPGFQIQKIFRFTYDGHQKSSDDRWDIPDRMTVVREDSCSLGFSSTSISGTESYSHSLENHISASLEGWGAKFKASVDYKQVEERTSKYKDLYTTSKGECKIYTAKIDTFLPPKLSESFVAALNSLPEQYDHDSYMEFIENFGTHFVKQIHMGARFTCITRLTESGWTSLLQKNIKVETAASFSAFGVTGALETRTEDQKRIAREFDSVKTEMTLSVVGAKPVKDHGVIEWAQQVIEEPMPMHYSLEPISNLLTPRYIQDSRINLDIKRLKENIEKGLMEYCEHLRKQRSINDCNPPAPDPPFPKIMNSCRLCMKECGGDFPVTSGAYGSVTIFGPGLYTKYNQKCEQPFTNVETNELVVLCCQQEDQTRNGACRYCATCGDEYPEDNGKVTHTTCFRKFFYDTGCHGEITERPGVPSLCCKKESICKYCITCGGEYKEETGVFGTVRRPFLEAVAQIDGLGNECNGRIHADVPQAKLCCKAKGSSLMEQS